MFIKEVIPSIIKDSREENTIQIEIDTLKGKFISSAPSGKSKGEYEAPAYSSRGIHWDLRLLKIFAEKIKNKNFFIEDFEGLGELDNLIKNFENQYESLGANSTYTLQTAFLKAAAKENQKELWEFVKLKKVKPKIPMPIGNCIGGGMHSHGLPKPDFQEFLLISEETSFAKAVTKNYHAYESAKKLIKQKEKKLFLSVNDEHAWRTSLNNEDALEILNEVADKFGLKIGLDIAASTFFDSKGYYHYDNKRFAMDREEHLNYMRNLIKKYDLFYIEDLMWDNDFSGFSELNSSQKRLIVGDDLTATNAERLDMAVQGESINAMIIKPNQNGSLLEVAKIVKMCKEHKIKIIFSHRSGETMDDALADYAVGFGADYIKTGIAGKERLVKLRRIIEIEKSTRWKFLS
ncbi:MAG: enolase C-terminal domain-like protein [Nanoarchaeota archaeon]|nr:enolase C-terminal domain-like protein [Nanoarchaeota archaeon]